MNPTEIRSGSQPHAAFGDLGERRDQSLSGVAVAGAGTRCRLRAHGDQRLGGAGGSRPADHRGRADRQLRSPARIFRRPRPRNLSMALSRRDRRTCDPARPAPHDRTDQRKGNDDGRNSRRPIGSPMRRAGARRRHRRPDGGDPGAPEESEGQRHPAGKGEREAFRRHLHGHGRTQQHGDPGLRDAGAVHQGNHHRQRRHRRSGGGLQIRADLLTT